jgi:hypothetical protein
MRESRNIELLDWTELTPEQQDYVIDNWSNIRKIADTMYDWFNEDTMMFYEENRDEIAQKYEKEYGLEINTEQLYWQSNSQGPYPEWKLNKVFSDISGADAYVDYDIRFGGVGGLDVEDGVSIDIYIDDPEEDERIFDNEYYLDELEQSPNVPIESFDKINNIIQGAQEFIDEFWNYVNEICTSYPDDDWVRDMLDNNPDVFDFYIKDNEVEVW